MEQGLFDLAFFDTHFEGCGVYRSESVDDFLRELFALAFAKIQPNSSLESVAKDLLGEELASYAVQNVADPSEDVTLSLGRHLVLELNDIVRKHLGPLQADFAGELSIDVFTIMCSILSDEALSFALGPYVSDAERKVAESYSMRDWASDKDYDGIVELHHKDNGVLDASLGKAAVPLFDLGVARVYDRHSGCYFRPLNQKIVRLRLLSNEEQALRVALQGPRQGAILLGNRKFDFVDGCVQGNADEETLQTLNGICALLWNNEYYEILESSTKKKKI